MNISTIKNKITDRKNIRSKVILTVLLLVVCFIPAVIRSNYILQIFCLVFLYGYWASCWNLIGGLVGQFALGNGLFIGIGAYSCAILMSQGASPFAAIPVSVALSVLIAYLVSSLCFRLSGTYFALATVAFLFIARYIMLGTSNFLGFKTGGGLGMIINWKGGWQYLQFRNKAYFYYIFLALLIVILLITNKIMKSRMGIYLTAIRTNPGAASTIGINVTKYKMYAQCLSAAFLAIGGVFYATFIMIVDPYIVLGFDLSLQLMIYCIIGGNGTLFGPLIGAGVLTLFNQIVRVKLGADIAQLSLVAYGVILIVIILFAPTGIVGLAAKLKARADEKQKDLGEKAMEKAVTRDGR